MRFNKSKKYIFVEEFKTCGLREQFGVLQIYSRVADAKSGVCVCVCGVSYKLGLFMSAF